MKACSVKIQKCVFYWKQLLQMTACYQPVSLGRAVWVGWIYMHTQNTIVQLPLLHRCANRCMASWVSTCVVEIDCLFSILHSDLGNWKSLGWPLNVLASVYSYKVEIIVVFISWIVVKYQCTQYMLDTVKIIKNCIQESFG